MELTYCFDHGLPHSEFLSWSEDDQDKVVAMIEAKNAVCPSCGTRKEEWEEDRFAYIADTHRCPGCELIEQEQENIRQLPSGSAGVKIFLRRNYEGIETSDEV